MHLWVFLNKNDLREKRAHSIVIIFDGYYGETCPCRKHVLHVVLSCERNKEINLALVGLTCLFPGAIIRYSMEADQYCSPRWAMSKSREPREIT